MRGILILFLLSVAFADGLTQSGKVPPFQMMMADGKIFRAQDLPAAKPIVIFYFSTDCEDCQELTEKLLKRIGEFSKASIAMVTFLPPEYLSPYIAKNRLYQYQNIFLGTEGRNLFLKNYYNIGKFPYIVLYDKNGNLIVNYKDKTDLDDLSLRLKSL